MLVRLVFASRAVKPCDKAIDGILQTARQHNQASGITGVLLYTDRVFMQVIEGARQAVSDLYSAISRDSRHQDVTLLHFEEIGERRFGRWTMGLVDARRVNASVLLKYGPRPELDPYAMPGRASLALIEELLASAQIAGHP